MLINICLAEDASDSQVEEDKKIVSNLGVIEIKFYNLRLVNEKVDQTQNEKTTKIKTATGPDSSAEAASEPARIAEKALKGHNISLKAG